MQQEFADGRILDADYAHEMARLSTSMIFQNATTAMIHKANENKDMLLLLIKD